MTCFKRRGRNKGKNRIEIKEGNRTRLLWGRISEEIGTRKERDRSSTAD